MKKDRTIERIKSCMAMESACSSVYHLLSLNFGEEKDLWNKLARDDELHAEIIATALDFREVESPAGFPIPADFDNIRNTISFAEEMRKLLVNNKLSLKEALVRLQELHELKNRSYCHDLLGPEKEEKVKNFFKKLFSTDKSNMDMIRAFADKYKP
jgi:predicted phage-related endonuclease